MPSDLLSGLLGRVKCASDKEISEWDERNNTIPMIRKSKLPARFHRALVDWGCDPQERVYRDVSAGLNLEGAIVVMVGARGTGKTTIAGQLVRGEAENGWIAPYRKMVDLISEFKVLYGDMGGIDVERKTRDRDWLCTRRLMVIDELHECEESRLKNRVLTDVLDRRYSAHKDTVLISNQTPEEFAACTSDSVLSRIQEHGFIVRCEWDSWRTKSQ